jgi:hypothetical protein
MGNFSISLIVLLASLLTINLSISLEPEPVLAYAQPRDIWNEEKLLDYFKKLNLSDHETKEISFDSYINKPEDWLQTRLRRNVNLHIASSYYDLEKAKDSIKEVVLQNSEQIVKWLNNPESILQRQFVGEFNEPIGHGFLRSNSDSLKNLSKARLVLAKKSNEIQVISTYPIE